MGLFKKAGRPKKEAVIEYSEVDQGAVESTPETGEPIAALDAKLKKVLENQGVIVQNQQTILSAIENNQKIMLTLAEAEEPEPTEEEIKAAIADARARKRKGGAA